MKQQRSALIGFTGLVGSNLCAQTSFSDRFNSANISQIRGRSYDVLICAGAPAAKWIANQNPEADLANLHGLMNHLKDVAAERFLLISTVDVYQPAFRVDEDSPIEPSLLDAYGRHRYFLEEFVHAKFAHSTIVRLPGLFGRGLKKNLIYDLLHSNCLDITHRESMFQFYNLENLWSDLQVVMRNDIPLMNLATEPVKAREVAWLCFGSSFETITEKPPVNYDMRTKYAQVFGGKGVYLYSASDMLDQIAQFVRTQRCLSAT